MPGVADPGEHFYDLPIRALVDLARRLDTHPADLVPELDIVLRNARRTVPAATDDQENTAAPATTMTEDSNNADHDDADARQAFTALAYAVEPLAIDDLAPVLDWPIERVTAALDHAERHPALAGPVALRRTQPSTYTITARLDEITAEQIRRLGQAQLYRHPLTADQVLGDETISVAAPKQCQVRSRVIAAHGR